MGIRPHNLLTIELQDETQDTMSCGMLGSKVDGVVSDFAVRGRVGGFGASGHVHVLGVVGVDGVGEDRVRRNQAGAFGDWVRHSVVRGCGEASR